MSKLTLRCGCALGLGAGERRVLPLCLKPIFLGLIESNAAVLQSCKQGSVLASDAFFPFAWNDSVELACKAGVKAIAHPGGSMRDQDALDCCNKYGVALVTTGVRHFRH